MREFIYAIRAGLALMIGGKRFRADIDLPRVEADHYGFRDGFSKGWDEGLEQGRRLSK